VLYFSLVIPAIYAINLFFVYVVCCLCSWQINDDDDELMTYNTSNRFLTEAARDLRRPVQRDGRGATVCVRSRTL